MILNPDVFFCTNNSVFVKPLTLDVLFLF